MDYFDRLEESKRGILALNFDKYENVFRQKSRASGRLVKMRASEWAKVCVRACAAEMAFKCKFQLMPLNRSTNNRTTKYLSIRNIKSLTNLTAKRIRDLRP